MTGATETSSEEFPLSEYQAFMENYVRRINEATLNVRFGGVRIGNAKYTRLAQINLQTRIITFSRYAIENVPERGRRYLVLHELAHVREASHNRRFWSMVAKHEPDYRRIGRAIQQAFKKNVEQEAQLSSKKMGLTQGVKEAQALHVPRQLTLFKVRTPFNPEPEVDNLSVEVSIECPGVISGGYEAEYDTCANDTSLLWQISPADCTADIC